jgi:hypothetical protein
VSKRNIRRIAAVAGVALAVGSAAPAMAFRIGAGAGAGVDVDPAAIVTDLTGSLPVDLADLPLPTFGQLSFLGLGALGVVPTTVASLAFPVAAANLPAVADNLNLDGILPESMDCGLVSVACASTGPIVDASNLNILGAGILSNNTDDIVGLNVLAPIVAPVGGILNGSILGGTDGPLGGLGFLGSILNVEGGAGVGLGGVVGLLGSL